MDDYFALSRWYHVENLNLQMNGVNDYKVLSLIYFLCPGRPLPSSLKIDSSFLVDKVCPSRMC